MVKKLFGRLKKCWPLLLFSCETFAKIKPTIARETENESNIMSTGHGF